MKKIYKSQIDEWLIGLIIFFFALEVYTSYSAFEEGALQLAYILLAAVPVELVLIVCAFKSCKYILFDDRLEVACLFIKQIFPYSKITKIQASQNFLSAPAFSLKRIRIDLDDGRFTLISPPNRENFIAELQDLINKVRPAK